MKLFQKKQPKKHPGRPKGSLNKPKEPVTSEIKKLSPELQELMAKKIAQVTEKLTDELNKQNLLIENSLDYKYLLKLVRLVDTNRDLEINITTKDGCNISIRNKPEEYKMDSWEDMLESLPEDDRGNITIK